jgi:GAF domain-containing protein
VEAHKTIIFDMNDPDLSGLEIEILRRAGAQTVVVVPMVYGDDVLGTISLSHSRRDAYANVDLPLLERVAQLTVVAVQNTRLFNQLSQRAMQLQTAAQVSQAATSILNLDQLLTETVELIRDRFNLYYVGLFLVDESTGWAVLRAGTGEAGRIQLERGHRLRIGSESMIGWCVANSQARIALDVGEEATRFKNPYLPETRSELALPLISRNQTIGALSVQSTSQSAFSQEDITTLQTMADQLANAIQNTRFFEQTRQALAETEALYLASAELNTAQSYEDILEVLRRHTLLGQDAQNLSLNLFDRPWTTEETPEWIDVAARTSQLLPSHGTQEGRDPRVGGGEVVNPRYPLSAFPSADRLLHPDTPTLIEDIASNPQLDDQARALYQQRFGAKSAIFIPLVFGGQWIGFISGIYQQATTFPEPEVRRLIALCSQAAAAVQSLRQLQRIQTRARREALIREITSKVRASTDLEAILQTTVAEVSRALGTFHGAIRLSTPGNADGDHISLIRTDASDNGGQQ